MGLSIQEVYNIFVSHVNIDRHEMPEVLCIDEFKNLKNADGKYAVILYDPINSTIIDIIESRHLDKLDEYFYNIPLKEKNRVKYLISDMYEGFRSIKKKHFYNATHIVDGFHFIRYVTNAVNTIRISLMSSFNTNTPEYRILKRYWNLLIKPINSLELYETYNPIQKKKTLSDVIIDDCLRLSDDLKLAYSLKEDFFIAFETLHYENSSDFLENFKNLCKNSNLAPFVALANTTIHGLMKLRVNLLDLLIKD